MPTILDFQIQSLSAESYSLTVCERGSSQPLASATFSHRVDFLTDFSVDRLNASTKDAAERFDELQKLGRELYQKLFPPAVDSNSQFERIMMGKVAQPAEVAPFSQVVDRESNATSAGCATVFGQIENCCTVEQVWREYKQRSEFLILCLRFAEGAMKLEVLPWETLHDGAEFIAAGAKTTLTRLPLNVAPPSELPPIPRPLRLFGFFASPLDLQDHERLNAEREQEILLEAINDPAAQGRISADFEDEAKLEILTRSLMDGYHILHFTGHGISPRDGGGLLLEDAHGKKLPASIADVMQAVQRGQDGKAKLRLAVISGCQTARTLHAGTFNDLAHELLRQHVPAVIAMQFSISDEGGLKFAEVLYREIAKGVALERAVHAARRVLLADQRFFINNDALAIVLLAADGACLQTTEAESLPPQAEPSATYLGDRLDPLAHGFYGRRREYRKIRDALLHQDQRAIIIHGIGGIGKTALLTHAINRLLPRFKDVMSFDCRRAALAPETILLELHRYFAAQGMPQLQSLIGQNTPPETLADEIAKLLAQWPLLIVFDNFESQLDERREFINEDLRVFLTTLVRATATGSRFLFTTRYLFDLDGERLGYLQELPLGDLSRAEAMMLMQKLPNLAQAAYRDKLAVLEKFGGHPYALVTLDRHCSHQSLEQALQDASSLKSELREYLEIEINYARLSGDARELLNRLAAFRQTVPLIASGWVIGKRESYAAEWLEKNGRKSIPVEYRNLEETDLLQLLEEKLPERRVAQNPVYLIAELIESSLLTPHWKVEQLESLSVHILVRDFCRDLQAEECWRIRLLDAAAFYTNQTKAMRQDDKRQEQVWDEMEAFELFVEAKDYKAATELLSFAAKLLSRWGFGRYLEGKLLRLLPKADRRSAAMIYNIYGTELEFRGEYEAALGNYESALEIRREMGDCADVATTLSNIGNIHLRCGKSEIAKQFYEQSRAIDQERGYRLGVASTDHHLGMLYQARGDYEMALELYEKSLKTKGELDDKEGCASSLSQIGNIYYLRAEYEIAFEKYERARMIAEELGDRELLSGTLHQIGMIQNSRGKHEKALALFERSRQISEELSNRDGMANSEAMIGQIYTEFGKFTEAFERLLFAFAMFLELQSEKARLAAQDLRRLRSLWGAPEFDKAWREATKQELPEWLKGKSEAAAL